MQALRLQVPEPHELVGTFRRFGTFGPTYEIIAVLESMPDGDTLLRVRLPESLEEAEVRFSHATRDPEAD